MVHDTADTPLPTLAYLMTDVVGSTTLWENRRKEAAIATRRLDSVCQEVVEGAHGSLVRSRGEGDSHFAVFHSAGAATKAAAELFLRVGAEPELSGVQLRAAVHIGSADLWAGDYYGPVVNRCARIRQAARPGQILTSEAVRALASAEAGTAFKDLGVHRLKDLMQPERLFQVLHPDLPHEFAPPDTLSELSHNLPCYLSSFVGRLEEIAELEVAIAGNRLTTVVGAGGVGKTRLTQQVAAELIESFKDGSWFIDFAQTDRSESVLPILCKELDVGGDISESSLLECLEHREMLLILDNCEHLFQECRRVAEQLLRRCSRLRILATSRRMLEVRGEFVYRLDGLQLPEPDLYQDAPRYDGFRLFVERTKQRGRALRLDDATTRGVVDLCRKLDGLPLAIEMAASLTDVMSVKEMSRSIAECLDLPTGMGIDEFRQRTISTTIEWSRKLLSLEAQMLVERLSFFPNTWNLEGACSVCCHGLPRQTVRELVRELVSHSLAFSVQTPRDDIRFGLLQTTREVISSRAGDQTPLVAPYIRYCLTLVEQSRALAESGDESAAYDLIESDYETLAKGLELAFRKEIDNCASIALGLRNFWMSGSRLPEGRAWYAKLSTCGLIDRQSLVSIQVALSSLTILLGDNDGALKILLEAEQTVRPIGGLEMARVIGNLAVHRDRMGRYAEAKEGFAICCSLFSEYGAKREEALSLMNLGVAKLRLAEPLEECAELYRRALDCAKSAGLTSMQAKAYSCLGHVHLKEGRLGSALECSRKSFALWLSDPVLPDSNLAMLDLAEVFILMERFNAAAKAIQIAERLEELSHSPLPTLHRQRLDLVTEQAKGNVAQNEWRGSQRLTRSKSVSELTTITLQLIETVQGDEGSDGVVSL